MIWVADNGDRFALSVERAVCNLAVGGERRNVHPVVARSVSATKAVTTVYALALIVEFCSMRRACEVG